MGRYYFDLFDGEEIHRDSEGIEFESAEAMRTSAFKTLLEIMGCQKPKDAAELMLLVRDAFDLPALTAELSLRMSCPAQTPVSS